MIYLTVCRCMNVKYVKCISYRNINHNIIMDTKI